MAITVVGTAQTINSSTIALPSGIQAHDTIIVAYGVGSGTITATGFTEITESLNPHILYKMDASGSEGTSFVGSATARAANVIVLRGVDVGTVVEAANRVSLIDPPSISPSWGSGVASGLLAVAYGANQTSMTVTGYPSGYTASQSAAVGDRGGGTWAFMAIGAKIASVTSDDPSAFTLSQAEGSGTVSRTLALKTATSTAYSLTAALGSFALTGNAATFQVALNLAAALGSFAFTGGAATLSYGKVLLAALGSFALTGGASAFQVALSLVAATGTFAFTGGAAVIGIALTLLANTGSFLLTGGANTFGLGLKLLADTGYFALSSVGAFLDWVNAARRAATAAANRWRKTPPRLQSVRNEAPSLTSVRVEPAQLQSVRSQGPSLSRWRSVSSALQKLRSRPPKLGE